MAVLVLRLGYLVYCVADPLSKYGVLTEDVAIRVVFGFIPGAIAALCLTIGGVAALRDARRNGASGAGGAEMKPEGV